MTDTEHNKTSSSNKEEQKYSKLRNGTKTFLVPKFFSIVKCKKLEFSVLLTV